MVGGLIAFLLVLALALVLLELAVFGAVVGVDALMLLILALLARA